MWQRLIGSLNIQAMATRPTMKPLKYQEKLKLKRITTKNSTMANSAIVRVYHNERKLVGFPKIGPGFLVLFDLNIAVFEASVLEETKSRLSTGDSFVIEIEVYLTNSSFAKILMPLRIRLI